MISDKCDYCRRRMKTVQWTAKFGRLCEKCSTKYAAGELNEKFVKKEQPEWRRNMNKRITMNQRFL